MAYDEKLPDDRNKVRFLIGDTDNADLILRDEEVTYCLSVENDDIFFAAARACETIAARFARDVNYRFSTMWQDAGDAFDHYMGLAERLRKSDSSEFTAIDLQVSPVMQKRMDDFGPEVFWFGMHDNPSISQDPS